MQTILGANGIIATELAKELYSNYTVSPFHSLTQTV